MNTTYYQAIASGEWNEASTWKNGNIPNNVGGNETVDIPFGIDVTISKTSVISFNNGLLQLFGNLSISGTFNITIKNYTYRDHAVSIGQFNPSKLTVENGGIINIDVQGAIQNLSTNFPVHGIVVNIGSLENNGTINIISSTTQNKAFGSIGRGYGITLNPSNATLDNYGSITIQSTDPTGDGYGPSFGIYASTGTINNHKGATITSTEPENGGQGGGLIFISDTATLNNDGSIQNAGQFWNSGKVSNTGEIIQNYPSALYHGLSQVTGNGNVYLTGSVDSQMSIQDTVPGQKNFFVPEQSTLTINKSFVIPSGYTLDANGHLVINDTITNNGLLKITLFDNSTNESEVSAAETTLLSTSESTIEQKVTGTGQVVIKGSVGANESISLSTYGSTIELSETITVEQNGILIIPSGVTLKINEGGALVTNSATSTGAKPGTLIFKGSIVNQGTLTNNGIFHYVFPSYNFTGNDLIDNGEIAISGILSTDLNIEAFQKNSITLPSGYTLSVPNNKTLTIPTGNTLITESDSSKPGTLSLNGKLEINGTLNNQGTVYSRGTIDLYSSIENSGAFTSLGVINHNFPATFSGTQATSVSRVNLQGIVSIEVDLATIGYGPNVQYYINPEETLTVNSKFTNPKSTTINNQGTITCKEGLLFQNDGILVHNFTDDGVWRFSKTITSTFTCDTFDGNGLVALNGVLTETITLDSISKKYPNQENFIVRTTDTITTKFSNDTIKPHIPMPSIRLEVRGEFWFEDAGTFFTVGEPPALEEKGVINFSLAFTEKTNYFGLAQLNPREQQIPTLSVYSDTGVGLWIHDLANPAGHQSYIYNLIRLSIGTSNQKIDNFNCGMLLEYAQITHVNWSDPKFYKGEVSAGQTPSIYCNNGNIIGNYSGAQPEGTPINSGQFVYAFDAQNVPGTYARPLDQQRKPSAFNQ